MRLSWILAGIPIALFFAVLIGGSFGLNDQGKDLFLSPIKYVVYGLYLIAMLLGGLYHLGRYLYLPLIQLLVTVLLLSPIFNTSPAKAASAALLATALLPWYYVLFAAWKDRPVWSKDGLVHLTVALGAVVLIVVPTVLLNSPMFLIVACVMSLIALLALLAISHAPLSAKPLIIGALVLFISGLWYHQSGERGVMLLFSGASAVTFIVVVLMAAWAHSFLDELTQLPARRLLKHDMAALPAGYCVAVLDLDHFKQINDRYGHDTGDQVLKYVAAKLKTITFGTAYRYGGEEFVILAPGKSKSELLPDLDRFRETLGANPFVLRDSGRPRRKPRGKPARSLKSSPNSIVITASMGVAQSTPSCVAPDEVLRKADQALYRAKANGRNRVEAAR